MLRHVSILRWVPGATAAQRQAVSDALALLPGQVPEIRAYRFGTDARISAGNWDLAIVADFDDAEGYVSYASHPAHLALVAEHIRPILAERAAVQHHLDAG